MDICDFSPSQKYVCHEGSSSKHIQTMVETHLETCWNLRKTCSHQSECPDSSKQLQIFLQLTCFLQSLEWRENRNGSWDRGRRAVSWTGSFNHAPEAMRPGHTRKHRKMQTSARTCWKRDKIWYAMRLSLRLSLILCRNSQTGRKVRCRYGSKMLFLGVAICRSNCCSGELLVQNEACLNGVVVPTKFTMAKSSMNHTVASPFSLNMCQHVSTVSTMVFVWSPKESESTACQHDTRRK